MTFRGYMTLNGVEITNSSRVAAHVAVAPPVSDVGVLTGGADCGLTPISAGSMIYQIPTSSAPIAAGSTIYTPPNGSRLYSEAIALVGQCWDSSALCLGCRSSIEYDDTWPGLRQWLANPVYRPELAPWYSLQTPQSAEFMGIWLLDVKGLNQASTAISVVELAGDGAAVGPTRDASRKVTFDALLLACTSAGLDFGLGWLTSQLKAVNTELDYGTLQYFSAHPGNSVVNPATLMREAHGVVLTQPPTISDSFNGSERSNQQATVYRVSWELTVTDPAIYLPTKTLNIAWDSVAVNPIQWVHASECGTRRLGCDPYPTLFADGYTPTIIKAISVPPPDCGGCLPVGQIATYISALPVFSTPVENRLTAVGTTITNTGTAPLSLQGYYRRCNALDDCDEGRTWQFQINGLPAGAQIVMNGTTGRSTVFYQGRWRRPVGIVGTPTGAPWIPPLMDRSVCWELVCMTSATASFTAGLTFSDREA